MKRSRAWTWTVRLVGVTSVLLSLAGVAVYLVLRAEVGVEPLPASGGFPPQASVAAVPSDLPKQGLNQCGAYSLALALRCYGEQVDAASMVGRVSHRLSVSESLSGTLPWRIQRELAERGMTSAGFSAGSAPRERRLDLLRAHLAQGAPVVVLVESERKSQHYVLAVGYGPDGFDLYDPNSSVSPDAPELTLDQNGARPGNRTLAPEALLDLWSRGGGAGLYPWWYLPVSRL